MGFDEIDGVTASLAEQASSNKRGSGGLGAHTGYVEFVLVHTKISGFCKGTVCFEANS